MTGPYAGKVVVITGGAGAIGTAIAARYGREGATVIALDNNAEAIAAFEQRFSESDFPAYALPLDITDPAACHEAITGIARTYGGIAVLVNNAGLTQIGPFEDNALEVYRRVMEVNFFGAVHVTKAALPFLIQARGAIAVMSSVAGFAPLIGRTGYCASKHALHGFFDTLRAELKPHGVGVTIVCPTFADTPFHRAGLDPAGQPLDADRTTAGAAVSPEAIADALFQGVRRGTPIVPVGRTARQAWFAARWFPQWYERQMRKRLAGDGTAQARTTTD